MVKLRRKKVWMILGVTFFFVILFLFQINLVFALECNIDSDCTNGDNGDCNILGQCHYCADDEYYSLSYAGCIQCVSNSECTEQEGGVCGILHTCFYCSGDTPFYFQEKCLECLENSDCDREEGGVCNILGKCHYCNGDTPFWKIYKCVECLENSDCTQQDGGSCDIMGRCSYPYLPETESEIPNDSSDNSSESEGYSCSDSFSDLYLLESSDITSNEDLEYAKKNSWYIEEEEKGFCYYENDNGWAKWCIGICPPVPSDSSSGGSSGSIFVPIPVPSSSGGEGEIAINEVGEVPIGEPSPSSEGGTTYRQNSSNRCNGCLLNGECHPFNNRQDGKYCSTNNNWTEQKFSDSFCENNFECKSNLCINSQCLSSGLWQRILNFFERIFRW